MNARLRDTLLRLGFSEEEGAVYLAALEVGSRPASVLAKRAKLKPGQTYNILERLISRGFVQEIEKSGVKHFTAAPPNRLLTELEGASEQIQALRERLTQALPALAEMRAPRIHQSKVRFYHGRNGVMQVVEDAIRTPDKKILGVLDATHQEMISADEDLERFLADARAKRLKAECWYYLLVSGSESLPEFLRTDRDRLRLVRRIPNVVLPVQFLIHGEKLSVYTYREPQFAVTIDDPFVAEAARNIFSFVWNISGDY